jgi:hypothetical protein
VQKATKPQQQRKSREQPCVYCGQLAACTRDHVVPKALFPGPLPVEMMTVPACYACNQRKADLDTYLRDFLTADLSSYWNPTARTILEGKVRRSVQKNRSVLWRRARAETRWVDVNSPGGIYLGTLPAMPLDGGRLNGALTIVVKGLYAHWFQKRLHDDCEFDIGRVDPLLVEQRWESLTQPGSLGPFLIGKDVFLCVLFVASNDPLVIHWLLGFYVSVFFVITTTLTNADALPQSAS